MFRGRLVDCHEVPDRLRYVLDELQRRPVGQLLTPDAAADVDAATARVHAPDYLAFLARAWDDWVALDPANAAVDALPSVWPLASKHGFRTDVPPLNFAARLGQFAFDSGTPLMAGSWAAARGGAACALAAAQAFERAFEADEDTARAHWKMARAHWEMVRLGEDDDDIEHDGSPFHDYRLGIRREIVW